MSVCHDMQHPDFYVECLSTKDLTIVNKWFSSNTRCKVSDALYTAVQSVKVLPEEHSKKVFRNFPLSSDTKGMVEFDLIAEFRVAKIHHCHVSVPWLSISNRDIQVPSKHCIQAIPKYLSSLCRQITFDWKFNIHKSQIHFFVAICTVCNTGQLSYLNNRQFCLLTQRLS